jgi:hypothetical protein
MPKALIDDVRLVAEEADSEVLEMFVLRYTAYLKSGAEKADYLARALALARANRRRIDEADCLFALAQIAQSPEAQRQLWGEAVGILKQIGATAWLDSITLDNPPCFTAGGI